MAWSLQQSAPLTGKALVIGAMNLDVVATAAKAAVRDDSNPGVTGFYAGGVGRNIAEGLARLGIDTTLLSAVGNDDAGQQLLHSGEQAGFATGSVVRLDQHHTSSYVAVNDSDGSLLYAISDMAIVDQMSDALFPDLAGQIAGAGVCVIDANLPAALIARSVALAGNCALVADAVSTAKCVRLQPVLASLALLKVNRQEAATLTGGAPEDSVGTLLSALLALGPEAVLMTLGQQGAILAVGDNVFEIAAPQVAVLSSVNGAGDALLAGLVAATLHGHTETEALRWGAVAAAMSLSTPGACCKTMTIESMAVQ